jgi:hypothetical protein
LKFRKVIREQVSLVGGPSDDQFQQMALVAIIVEN